MPFAGYARANQAMANMSLGGIGMPNTNAAVAAAAAAATNVALQVRPRPLGPQLESSASVGSRLNRTEKSDLGVVFEWSPLCAEWIAITD